MQNNNGSPWDEKKIQLLKVAQQIFARFGYFKATMDDIAQAMGMKKGSLYYYYKSKEDILREVIRYESDQFLGSVAEELSTISDVRRKIEYYLNARLERFKEIMNIHNISIQAYLETTDIILELHQECLEKELDFLVQIIEEGIHQNVFKPYSSRKIAQSILTYAEAVKYREFHKNKSRMVMELDFASMAEEILFTIRLILDGMSINAEEEER